MARRHHKTPVNEKHRRGRPNNRILVLGKNWLLGRSLKPMENRQEALEPLKKVRQYWGHWKPPRAI